MNYGLHNRPRDRYAGLACRGCDACLYYIVYVLSKMATSTAKVFKEGLLEKRQRGLNHPNATHLKFQKRYIKLTTEGLTYYDEKKRERKKTVQLQKIKIIEPLDQSVIEKDFCFQVGDNEEVLYLASLSLDERSEWMQAFQEAAAFVGNEMLSRYHPGVFSVKSKTWSCCQNVKATSGCAESHWLERTVIRRTKKKNEKPPATEDRLQHPHLCKVKFSSECGRESGYSTSDTASRASENMESILKEPSKTTRVDQGMTHLQSCMPSDSHEISSVKFMAEDVLVLMTNNCCVHIYDIPSNTVIHNIQLTEPISSIDAWKEYLLIGSTLVHVVDTKEGHWRRIVVVDMKEKGKTKYLATFNSTGEFVTASVMGNTLTFWPQPSESSELMTESNMTVECGDNIASLDSMKHTLFVAHKSAVDVFNWSSTSTEIKCVLTISVPVTIIDTKMIAVSKDGKYVYMIEDEKEVVEFSVNTRHTTSICKSNEEGTLCLVASYHPTDNNYYIITGYRSGKVQIKDTLSQKEVPCLLPQKSGALSAVTAVAYRNNMIAVGHQNGTLNIWGGSDTVLVSKMTALKLLEIAKFSVYMPGSFSRHAIIADTFSFEVDSRGGIFTNRPSYSLEIPRGAIGEGESVIIQTGYITSLGNDRFQFPDGYTVVSSVVWFCTQNETEFNKPMIIELQHSAKNTGNLTVLKAKCPSSSAVFMFEPVGKGSPQCSEYASFETRHFCLFCCGVPNLSQRVCVIPIEKPYIEERKEKEVIFCVCYYRDTCIREVNRQYKNEAVNHVYDPIPVSIEADRISFECSLGNAALKSGTNEVLVGELDFTRMNNAELVLAQEQQNYPPRVCYACKENQSDERVEFTFSGVLGRRSYEVLLKSVSCTSCNEPPPDKKPFHGTPKMEDCPFGTPVFKPFQ